jgi:hypothetical protein
MTEARMDDDSNNSIYVLLTDTGTWFTRMIKLFTSAPYNHASLALDSNLQDVYSFGRKRANNPFIAGFVKEDVYAGTFRQFPDTRCVLLRITLTEKQRAALVQVVREFEKKKENYRYNLIGLIGVLLEQDIQPTDSYFCSQFVAEAMRSSGINLWKRPSTQVTPHDFLKHEQFQVVYEGLLYDYPKLNRKKLIRNSNSRTTAVFFRKRVV